VSERRDPSPPSRHDPRADDDDADTATTTIDRSSTSRIVTPVVVVRHSHESFIHPLARVPRFPIDDARSVPVSRDTTQHTLFAHTTPPPRTHHGDDPSKYAGTSEPGNQFGRAALARVVTLAPRRSVAIGIAARVNARARANIVVVEES